MGCCMLRAQRFLAVASSLTQGETTSCSQRTSMIVSKPDQVLGTSRQHVTPFESTPLLIVILGNLHITPLTKNDLMMSVLGVKRQAYCCRSCNIVFCIKSAAERKKCTSICACRQCADDVQLCIRHAQLVSIACRQMTGAVVGCARAPQLLWSFTKLFLHPSHSSVVRQCGLQRHAPTSLSASWANKG